MAAEPREVQLVRERLTAIAAMCTVIGSELLDLYHVAHEQPTGDQGRGAKVKDYDQLSRNARAVDLWHRLTQQPSKRDPRPTLVSLDDHLAVFYADLARLFHAGERSSARVGRPIKDAELAEAIAAQKRRQARGEYSPKRNVRQPGPVRR